MFAIYKVFGHLAMPLPAALLLAFAGGVILRGPTGRAVVAAALGVLWLASTPALSRRLLRPRGKTDPVPESGTQQPSVLDPSSLEPAALEPASVEPADVVVVLSGGFPWRDLFAIQLFQLGKAPLILFSGRLSARSEGLLHSLIDLTRTPRDQLLMETESRTTAEGGRAFRALASQRGWRSALLVSSAYHLRRALHHYRCPSVQIRGVPCPEPGLPPSRQESRLRPLDQRLTDLIPHPHGLMHTYLALRERISDLLTAARS